MLAASPTISITVERYQHNPNWEGRPYKNVEFGRLQLSSQVLDRRGCGFLPAPGEAKSKPDWNGFKPCTLVGEKVRNVVLHRHPISGDLQVQLLGGLEDDVFPSLAMQQKGPGHDKPLTEGEKSGTLKYGDELLEIDGRVVVGRPHNEVKALLKASGDEVVLRVVAPVKEIFGPRRTITGLLQYAGNDLETIRLSHSVRQILCTEVNLFTTNPAHAGDENMKVISEPQLRELAAGRKLFEWMRHKSGHYYAISREVRKHVPGSDSPAVVPEALAHLVPAVPPVSRIVRSPSTHFRDRTGSVESVESVESSSRDIESPPPIGVFVNDAALTPVPPTFESMATIRPGREPHVDGVEPRRLFPPTSDTNDDSSAFTVQPTSLPNQTFRQGASAVTATPV